MRSFLANTGGNIAIMFGLTSAVVLAAAGMAIDYSRAVNVRSFVQAQADAAALSGVHLGKKGDTKRYLDFVRAATEQRYGKGAWIDAIKVKGKWLSPTDFNVSVKGVVPVTLLSAVPGFPDAVPIAVEATARIGEPKYVYKAPKVTQLDPEAADYNRIAVYCFDPKQKDDPKTLGRLQMTVIADNAGTKYNYKMPECAEGQALSYRLTNVREARANPQLWDDPHVERYTYYTDTVIQDGVEKYGLDKPILETVLCDRLGQCEGKGEGGIIPEGKNRTPQQTTKACEPGKFLYYGWEDRPPGSGWTDQDYDDIRIVIQCPSVEQVGERTVRLVQ